MFCPKCGAQIPDEASFCPHCGARISGGSSVHRTDREPVKKKGGGGFIKKLLVLLFIISMLWGAYPYIKDFLGEGDDGGQTAGT